MENWLMKSQTICTVFTFVGLSIKYEFEGYGACAAKFNVTN